MSVFLSDAESETEADERVGIDVWGALSDCGGHVLGCDVWDEDCECAHVANSRPLPRVPLTVQHNSGCCKWAASMAHHLGGEVIQYEGRVNARFFNMCGRSAHPSSLNCA